jgi:glycosyltransferase involved in cell wall biosynthesis
MNFLFRQSRLLNELSMAGVSSNVLFTGPFKSPPKWPDNFVTLKTGGVFNRFTDLVVIPEIQAHQYAPLLRAEKVRYAIFAQNGYYVLNTPLRISELSTYYEGAVGVISTSDLITRTLSRLFPRIREKIHFINYSIDPKVFHPRSEKSNIITYMPRKLQYDSRQVLAYLEARGTKNWRIMPIDGLDQAGVASLLRASKIFMSFSDFEGFGLPPVEAALAGNRVIGYTGEGGKEYWNQPIFEEIFRGDIMGYANAVEREMLHQSKHPEALADIQVPSQELAARYSEANEIKNLTAFVDKMVKVFAAGV